MIDREKVIKALERCLICDISVVASPEAQKAYLECEYTVGRYCGKKKVLRDALSLLKENGAVEPKVIRMNDFGHPVHACGKCGLLITESMNYCSRCGQAVKWT